MKKLCIIFTLAISIILSDGCSSPSMQQQAPISDKIVLTDIMGREVVLTQPAKQVVGTDFAALNTAVVLAGGSGLLAGCGDKHIA